MQLVLASTSPYRRILLERLQIPFVTARPDADETPLPGETPEALANRLARMKAESLATSYTDALIIGSDQVATLDDVAPIGKPGNRANAEAQLRAASGQTVTFYTGLCVINTTNGQVQQLVDRYEIQIRDLSLEEINAYVDQEQPFDCAGSFKAEGLGSTLFARHHGSDPTSLIGLPLIALCECLRQQGFPILGAGRS
ncbi:MAG: Maf family nucleotide pyrophosphatase [Natronospirillum sp.]